MGVVNVTPDSFSDGGRYLGTEAAVAHARRLLAEGADMLDIGGESTRPGARPVSVTEELERVLPLVRAIRAESAAPISIDTMKPEVMRAAAAEGADLWNDVTALRFSPKSLDAAAELGCQVMLMHMQGEPRTMQDDPVYEDVVAEVCAFLQARAEAAMTGGRPARARRARDGSGAQDVVFGSGGFGSGAPAWGVVRPAASILGL
jgi:dihydropteroate synthase